MHHDSCIYIHTSYTCTHSATSTSPSLSLFHSFKLPLPPTISGLLPPGYGPTGRERCLRAGNSHMVKRFFISCEAAAPRNERVLVLSRVCKMFCGGSFRCKTIDKNDQYKLVKLNGSHIKIVRSPSVVGNGFGRVCEENATGSINRRIFLVQNKSVSCTGTLSSVL